MGKHSMTCSIKSIRATPTAARAIIKCRKKSDAGDSEMAIAWMIRSQLRRTPYFSRGNVLQL